MDNIKKHQSLTEILSYNLRKALLGLICATLLINALLAVYEIRSLTATVYETFASQLQNVARVSSQRGDLLSLQKDLNAVASPLGEIFSVEIEIRDLSNQKMIVYVPQLNRKMTNFFIRTVKSNLEMNPSGSLEAVIKFNVQNIVLMAMLKAFLSIILIYACIYLLRGYVEQINHQNLDPIDRFSKWLDSIGPEEMNSGNLRFPTDGLHAELKIGLEGIASKIAELSNKNALLEANKQVGEMAKRVAHDIRSPLTALNMFLSKVNELNDEQKNIIRQVSERINLIANNLLDFNKRESSINLKENHSYLDLASTLEEIVQEKRIEFSDRPEVKIELNCHTGSNNLEILFCTTDFKRILSNLLNNSFDAIANQGYIHIELWKSGGSIFIRIIDNGVGISDEVMKHLKYQEISSKISGAGIGIFSANELLNRFGHELEIHSKIGVGTQIILKFNEKDYK